MALRAGRRPRRSSSGWRCSSSGAFEKSCASCGRSTPPTLVLAGAPSIAATVASRRLTWLGRIARMVDAPASSSKMLFSQQPGRRHRERPRLTLRLRHAMEQDVCDLHGGQRNGRSWYVESQHHKRWQQAVLAFQTTGTAPPAPAGGGPSTAAGGSAGANGSGSSAFTFTVPELQYAAASCTRALLK